MFNIKDNKRDNERDKVIKIVAIKRISLSEDLYLKTDVMLSADIFEKLWGCCGTFHIKNNKRDIERDKVTKIIKGQSNKNYKGTRLSYRN